MSWAHYLLQVNIYLIVFYCFYKLLLDKETYFILNRIYLLSAGLLSMVIPLLRFEWLITQPVAQPVYTGVDQLSELMTQVAVLDENPERLNASDFIVILYLLGVVFFIVRFIFQLYVVNKLLKKASSGTAFSFFRKMIIDRNLPKVQTIKKHEEIHVRQLHTLDILFFEALGILNWFNPAIYFYKTTIKNIHEYLADEEAAKYHGDKRQYVLLLLSTVFGVKQNHLTDSFFDKSFVKKRVYMLCKQRSKKTALLKYGIFLPLFALALVLSSATIGKNKELQAVSAQIPTENPVEIIERIAAPITATKNKRTNKPIARAFKVYQDTLDKIMSFVDIEKQPSFPGGMKNFYDYLGKTLKYPAEALKNKVEGKVFLSFIVEKDGSLTSIKVDRKLGSGTDEEALRVLNKSPKWIPGIKEGKNVRVKYNIPISFNLAKHDIRQDTSKKSVNLLLRPSFLPLRLHTRQDTTYRTNNVLLRDPHAPKPLILLDGKIITLKEMAEINPKDIQALNIIKDHESLKTYGEAGKNGVILITSKNPAKN